MVEYTTEVATVICAGIAAYGATFVGRKKLKQENGASLAEHQTLFQGRLMERMLQVELQLSKTDEVLAETTGLLRECEKRHIEKDGEIAVLVERVRALEVIEGMK